VVHLLLLGLQPPYLQDPSLWPSPLVSASILLMPFLNPNLKSAILLCCAKALCELTDFCAKPFIFEPRTNFPAVARTLLFISS
jgi:hypothetical protein